MFSLPMLGLPGFEIAHEAVDRTLTLSFRGTADMSSSAPLYDFLRAVHSETSSRQLTSVVVDFRSLEFMNSSCFKCFVEWLGKVQDLPEDDRYRVVFEANQDMHWQRRSLNALRCIATDVVAIESR